MEQAVYPAVEAAYDTYADLLYRLALAHLKHREDALDAVQDVFVKFAAAPKTFSDSEHERAWFVRVTINRCHDLQRRRKLRQYHPLDELIDTPARDDTLRPAILEAVDTLPHRYKSVIVLHYLEGFSVNEIALMLKLSVSAIKMRLSRAREILKTTYKEEDFYV